MKINPGDRPPPINPTIPLNRETLNGSPQAFGELLEQTCRKSEQIKPVWQPVIQPSAGASTAAAQIDPYLRTERVMDSMERYCQLLADPGVSLRSMSPAMRQLKGDVASLEPMLSNMAEDDPLKPLATEATILASKEIARFDRGDYIDD